MATATVNGIQLHYELHGRGAPLLLVHGLGSSGRDWEKQVEAFASRYRIITVDLRGHGRSGRPPGPYSITAFAADLAALLRSLDLGPAHVVGLSLGGVVSLQLAAEYPDLIRSAVIVNSGPDLRPRGLAQRLQLLQRRVLILMLGLRPFGRILGRRLFPDPANAGDLATFEQRFADNDRASYLAALDAVMCCDLRPRLEDIRCPVLLIAAEHDYWPIETKRETARRLADARVVMIPDSRHALPVERPAAFNRALAEFLDAQE